MTIVFVDEGGVEFFRKAARVCPPYKPGEYISIDEAEYTISFVGHAVNTSSGELTVIVRIGELQ